MIFFNVFILYNFLVPILVKDLRDCRLEAKTPVFCFLVSRESEWMKLVGVPSRVTAIQHLGRQWVWEKRSVVHSSQGGRTL